MFVMAVAAWLTTSRRCRGTRVTADARERGDDAAGVGANTLRGGHSGERGDAAAVGGAVPTAFPSRVKLTVASGMTWLETWR